MRAGVCTVQQALSPESSCVVKQAVGLARRRGHAQVTPLHVANAMLTSTTSIILRAACLRSHSHPLQCKALELCFNVALNRLPAATTTAAMPMLASITHLHHSNHPSLSNALVAAFKRAQAHQRRGGGSSVAENQHQPILAVKIELEQLIISILDDPSVSRVMREAGFSSTHVKLNVELAVSGVGGGHHHHLADAVKPSRSSSSSSSSTDNHHHHHQPPARSEDVASVLEMMAAAGRKKRSVVVVGECSTAAEAVVKGVTDRIDGGDVPEVLAGLRFVNLPISSFAKMTREEVEHKVGELARSSSAAAGAALYLGDLKWAAEYRASSTRNMMRCYCPVEHAVVEIGRLINDGSYSGGGSRFWVVGVATYQTYMKCRIGSPSLETLWGLVPLTVPAGSLALSLTYSDDDDRAETKEMTTRGGGGGVSSCLPSWLRKCQQEAANQRKWPSETMTTTTILLTRAAVTNPNSATTSETMDVDPPPARKLFKELSTENLRILCDAMERRVPWHIDIFPDIATAVLRCRSGMIRRKFSGAGGKEDTWMLFDGADGEAKVEVAKELASVVFGSSGDDGFVYLDFRGGHSPMFPSDDSGDSRSKRSRSSNEASRCHDSCLERFFDAVRENPRRVFFLDGIDGSDRRSRRGIRSAFEEGKVRSSSGEEAGVADTVVVLICDSFVSSPPAMTCSPAATKRSSEGEEEEVPATTAGVLLDLNICAADEDGDDVDVGGCSVDDVAELSEFVDRTLFFNVRSAP